MTTPAPHTLSVKQLKLELRSLSIDHSNCVEKHELVARLEASGRRAAFLYGGGRFDYVETLGKREEAFLVCCICIEPFVSPVRLSPCSHLLCAACAQSVESCPQCRAMIEKRSADAVDATLLGMLDALQVRCANDGCDWSGDRSARLGHIVSDCPAQLVPCANGCGKDVARRTMNIHTTSSQCTVVALRAAAAQQRAKEEAARAKLAACRGALDALRIAPGERVELVCAGRPIVVQRSLLTSATNSVLATIGEGDDAKVELNLDYNVVSAIVEYVRWGSDAAFDDLPIELVSNAARALHYEQLCQHLSNDWRPVLKNHRVLQRLAEGGRGHFRGVTLRDCIISDVKLKSSSFLNCNLANVKFINVTFVGVFDFKDTVLANVSLSRVTMFELAAEGAVVNVLGVLDLTRAKKVANVEIDEVSTISLAPTALHRSIPSLSKRTTCFSAENLAYNMPNMAQGPFFARKSFGIFLPNSAQCADRITVRVKAG